jgi:SAM-dependent methyltransferase
MTSAPSSPEQRARECAAIDDHAYRYHLAQWENPKRSTLHFNRFVAPEIERSRHVADLGCGAGAATAFLAERAPSCQFVGIELSRPLVEIGNRMAHDRGVGNVTFEADDWYQLRNRADIDGVVSLQSLSWLPEFEVPLLRIFERLAPRWVAVSSLFYEGDISCAIEVNEHTRERKSFYNVYSIPSVDRFCRQHGYRVAQFQPFEIDIDVPPPVQRDLMGTFTVTAQSQDGGEPPRRLQISGPLLMNWYFLLMSRS